MATPFWEGQYTEGMTNLEELGVVPTWKRDNFTSQELQKIAVKVQNCNSLNELLALLRSDLSTANCAYEGPKQTGREVADYLEKIFTGEKITLTELREKTFYLGLSIPGKLSLLALTEKLTKEAPSIDRATDGDLGSHTSWTAPLYTSRPKGMSAEEWLKMQNNITAKRPRVKTKEELEASLPKAFPMTWSAQVPTDAREPENLDHWDAWIKNNEQSNLKGSTITPMPQEIDSRQKLEETLGDTYSRDREPELQEGAGRTFPPRQVPGFGTATLAKISDLVNDSRSKAINLAGGIAAQVEEARAGNNKTPITLVETPLENTLHIVESDIPKPPTPPYSISKQSPITPSTNITMKNESSFDAFSKSTPVVEKVTMKDSSGNEMDITDIAHENRFSIESLPKPSKSEVTPQINKSIERAINPENVTPFPKEKPRVRSVNGVFVPIISEVVSTPEPETTPEIAAPAAPVITASVPETSVPMVETVPAKKLSAIEKADEILSRPSKLGINWAKVQREYDEQYNSSNTQETNNQIPARDFMQEKSNLEKEIRGAQMQIEELRNVVEKNKALLASRMQTQKTVEETLSADVSSLSDAEKQATLKPLQEAIANFKKLINDKEAALATFEKEQSERTLRLANTIAEEKAALLLVAQAQQQNQSAAPIVPNTTPNTASVPEQIAPQIPPPATPNTAPIVPPAIPPIPNAANNIPTLENLTPFDSAITSQKTVADLCKLLISPKYKNHMFGTSTRTTKGLEIANRITENVLKAKVGGQLDPYFFIPDRIIADKVHQLLTNGTEWKEGVSQYGTIIFEKTKNANLSPDTRKSVDRVIATVAETAKPGMWQRIKKWANSGIVSGKEVSETRKQLGKVGFWASLIAALGIGVAAYSQEGKAENISQAPSQPVAEASQDGGAVVAAQNTEAVNESVSTSSANQIQQVGAPQMKTIEVVDEKTGQKYTLQAPIDTVTRNTNNEVPQQTGSANTNNTLVQQSSTEQPQSNPADIAIPTDDIENSNAKNPADIAIPTDTPDEAAPQTVERPASFESVTNLKNYFAKTGKLAAFERLYGYADGQAEKTRNQLPSSRAYWFETMLLEKPKEVLRTNAGGGMTPSELQYAIKRYRQQETGFFDTQIDPIDIREIRTKQDALTAWHAKYIGPLNEELKQLGSTSKVLNNPNTTMAEYLVDVIDRAEKNGLGDKLGLSPLTSEKLQEVLNYKPEVAASDLSAAELTTADLAAPKQGELETNRSPGIENIENFSDYQVSERTQWLRDTLSGATLDGVEYGNLRDINDWLNYRLNPVIEGYWDQKRQSESLRGGVYTITDLEYMIAGFKELGTRLDRLGRRDDDGNRIPVDTDRTAQIQRILNDLEDELANKQSRSNTPGRISI